MGFGIFAPFADRPLPRLEAFVPFFEAIILVTDFITSVLLFAYFSIYHFRALLALASGYLFTAMIVIPHLLTFPGVFSPTGLLGAGLQSTAWLYLFWHVGFPGALLIYAWLRHEKRVNTATQSPNLPAFVWSVTIVFSLVCGLTWLATAGEEFLPRLYLDRTHVAPINIYAITCLILICATALAALGIGRRSVLDQWLMIVALALILEAAFVAVLSGERFSLGFYAGRVFSLIASTVVLVVLLAETLRMYARLARLNSMLQRERMNKLMNLEVMAASISHEVRQPLAAIALNGGAALRFLGRTPPDLEEVRSFLNMMVNESHRAGQVFDNLRPLFGSADKGQEKVDVNEVVAGVLHALRTEFKDRKIEARVELTAELPPIMGNRGQLREVIVNLVHNAIEAMAEVNDDCRVLQVRTGHQDDAITMTVEDSGPGIDPEKVGRIFDAFVTTKPGGMGLGLAICQMIIQRHAGNISASPAHPRGAVFQIVLPSLGRVISS